MTGLFDGRANTPLRLPPPLTSRTLALTLLSYELKRRFGLRLLPVIVSAAVVPGSPAVAQETLTIGGDSYHASSHDSAVSGARDRAGNAARSFCRSLREVARNIEVGNPVCDEERSRGIDGWSCTASASFYCD